MADVAFSTIRRPCGWRRSAIVIPPDGGGCAPTPAALRNPMKSIQSKPIRPERETISRGIERERERDGQNLTKPTSNPWISLLFLHFFYQRRLHRSSFHKSTDAEKSKKKKDELIKKKSHSNNSIGGSHGDRTVGVGFGYIFI